MEILQLLIIEFNESYYGDQPHVILFDEEVFIQVI